jgi:CTP synthase
MCRGEQPLDEATRKKLSLFCQVPADSVVSLHDISNLYQVPLLLAKQEVGAIICNHFGHPQTGKISPTLPPPLGGDTVLESRLCDWKKIADRTDACKEDVVIAVVGKYTNNPDAYLSVVKALKHAALEAGLHLTINWVESSDLEPNVERIDAKRHDMAWASLRSANGVLVPGGFGNRGIEGKVMTANYCRTSSVPYLGICVGFQTAVIEFGRNELGWEAANSTEFDESTPHPVVVFLPESSTTVMGGTMRLGSRATILRDSTSLARKIYGGQTVIYERHRHRYEVNKACVPAFEAAGLRFSGQDDRAQRMEVCEVASHPFFVACQFHPEFKTGPGKPAPLFLALVLAASGHFEERIEADKGSLKIGAGFEREVGVVSGNDKVQDSKQASLKSHVQGQESAQV